jgi:hypothetical protein
MKMLLLALLVLTSAALVACAPVPGEDLPSLPAVATPSTAAQDI